MYKTNFKAICWILLLIGVFLLPKVSSGQGRRTRVLTTDTLRGRTDSTIHVIDTLFFQTDSSKQWASWSSYLSTVTTLGTSDDSISSQLAIKTYSDTKLTGALLSINNALAGDSDDSVSSQKAIKTFIDSENLISVKNVTSLSDDDAYDILVTDYFIADSPAGDDDVLTLPTVSGNRGKIYVISKTDDAGFNTVIEGNGAETINGNLNVTISTAYHSITVICDGSEWFIIAEFD